MSTTPSITMQQAESAEVDRLQESIRGHLRRQLEELGNLLAYAGPGPLTTRQKEIAQAAWETLGDTLMPIASIPELDPETREILAELADARDRVRELF